MKKLTLRSVLAALLILAVLPIGVFAAELKFSDVPADAWYFSDVKTAVEDGLVNGRTEDTFCPDEQMTAAEAVKLAACMYQKSTEGSVSLENGDPWYASYVAYAKEKGIITKDYEWNDPVTRAEYMDIFARALPEDNYTAINDIADGAFPDVPADHPQAAEIYLLARAGIVQGDEAHNCKPADPIKRSEVSAILTRMMHPEARKSFSLDAGKTSLRAYDYVGMWNDSKTQRATVNIIPADEYGFYDVLIHWGDSVNSYGEWTMTASFDENTGRMSYKNGEMDLVTLDANGAETREERWNDGEGYFLIGSDGFMSWQDSREERSGEFRIERLPIPVPSSEDIVAGYFGVIGGIETETAGASMKRAIAISEAIRFATESRLWSADTAKLRENLLNGWKTMTKDEQAAFDANFISVLQTVNSVLDDWDANKGVFEDAGVADRMEAFRKDPAARLSWSVLTSNTLTMGNSDGN